MRNLKLTLPLVILTTIISSCGPKDMGSGNADHLMDSLSWPMDLSEMSYDQIITTTPANAEKAKYGNVLFDITFDVQVKSIKKERVKIDAIEIYDGDEYLPNDSKALKDAAIAVVDAYLECANNEMKEIQKLVGKKYTVEDSEVQELIEACDDRMYEAYNAYSVLQEKMAGAYNIILI